MKRNLLISILGLGLLAGLGYLSVEGLLSTSHAIQYTDIAIESAPTDRVCLGSLVMPYEDVSDDEDFDPRQGMRPPALHLVTPGSEVEIDSETQEHTVLEASETGPTGVPLGVGVQLLVEGDLRGLATGQCQPTTVEGYFLPVQTTPGESLPVLHVHNPHSESVEVTLEAWSAAGSLDLSLNSTVSIPPESSQQVLLQAITTETDPFVLRVRSSSLPVATFAQHTRLSGLDALGTDWQPGARPGTHVGITSYAITEDDDARVQIFSHSETSVNIAVYDDAGERVANYEDIRVAEQEALQVPLSDIPEGTYGIEVTADAPVVVGGYSQAEQDTTWASSVAAGTSAEIGFAASPSYDRELGILLVDQTQGSVDVEYLHTDGSRSTEQVAFSEDNPKYRVLHPADDVVAARLETSEGTFIAGGQLSLDANSLQGLSHLSPQITRPQDESVRIGYQPY